jgi:nucleoside 2-deoxyribosyltransferase
MDQQFSIYVAGPWKHRDDVSAIAAQFEAAGFAISHRWWDFDGNDADSTYLRECAVKDVLGVMGSDVLVVVNAEMSEGKAVETGIAIALDKPIVIIGERSNIFHHLNVYLTSTPEEVKWICSYDDTDAVTQPTE